MYNKFHENQQTRDANFWENFGEIFWENFLELYFQHNSSTIDAINVDTEHVSFYMLSDYRFPDCQLRAKNNQPKEHALSNLGFDWLILLWNPFLVGSLGNDIPFARCTTWGSYWECILREGHKCYILFTIISLKVETFLIISCSVIVQLSS